MTIYVASIVEGVQANTDPYTGAVLGGAIFTIDWVKDDGTMSGSAPCVVSDITQSENQIRSDIKAALSNYLQTNFNLNVPVVDIRLL